jgi:hypothetical protein
LCSAPRIRRINLVVSLRYPLQRKLIILFPRSVNINSRSAAHDFRHSTKMLEDDLHSVDIANTLIRYRYRIRRHYSSPAVSPRNYPDEGGVRILFADGRWSASAPVADRPPPGLLCADCGGRQWPVARGPDDHGVLQHQPTTTLCLSLALC